jgi:predicted RNA binding protein YcfA (HicA-like mRNA interferase family)
MNARQVRRRIERLGGVMIRQRGSHRLYRAAAATSDGGRVTASTVVPSHPGDLPAGTVRAIEKDLIPVHGEGWLR